jgi:hypothetical protein
MSRTALIQPNARQSLTRPNQLASALKVTSASVNNANTETQAAKSVGSSTATSALTEDLRSRGSGVVAGNRGEEVTALIDATCTWNSHDDIGKDTGTTLPIKARVVMR